MQHVLRTLVIAAAVAFSGMNACAPTQSDHAPPAGPLTAQPPAGDFKSSVDSSRLIYVTPIEGVNTVARLVLADAIAAALRDAKKPAVLADKNNDMGPTVSGRIVEVQERDSVYWVTASWALKAPYGTPVAEFRHQIVVDKKLWQSGAPEAINLLVADAGPMVAGMVSDYVSPTSLAPLPPATEAAAKPAAPPAPDTKTTTPAKDAANQTAAADVPPAPAPSAKPAAAAAPAKAPQIHPKTIPRRPARIAPALTAKPPEKPLETAALETPPAADEPKPATMPARSSTTGRPTLLSRGTPPKQPPEQPADDPGRRKAAKPVLMPVPEEGPGLLSDPPPVTWSRPSFLIKAVEGAPGDGNLSLMRAMKTALRKRDLTVTEDPRQAGFIIVGRVQVGPAVNGRQQAKIVWAVNTVSGEEVGKAVQENAVAAGSLDGAWGRLAEIVSNAAVAGIQELFGVAEKQSSRADLPPVPPLPNLPRVPGRAPPPPN